jgi:aspartate racemase
VRTLGIIGGIAPESTVEYYRGLVSAYRERVRDGSYPSIVIDSIDLQKMLALAGAGALEELTQYLLAELRRLADAGASVALLASNTPHIVFDELRRRSPIPLVSIVEAACAEAKALGLGRVGLFGTRFTMEGRFYPDVFSREGIALVLPSPEDQAFIHDRYMGELVHGVFRPETRDGLLAVVDRLVATGRIEGLVLGGTELPLILRDPAGRSIPFLDTTRLHVAAAMKQLLA